MAVWSGIEVAVVEALRRGTTGSAWRGTREEEEAGLTLREEVERVRAGEEGDVLGGEKMLFSPAEYGQAVVRRSMG